MTSVVMVMVTRLGLEYESVTRMATRTATRKATEFLGGTVKEKLLGSHWVKEKEMVRATGLEKEMARDSVVGR
ncbi:MAG: hypothetical protein KY429_07960 [Actinobacteria bacterium]|nr:hypothetical protein [Actinomycetota bacterium]